MEKQKHKLSYDHMNLCNLKNPRFVGAYDDNVKRYFKDVRKFKRLTEEQERELVLKIKTSHNNCDRDMNTLMGSHQAFVVMFAKRHCPHNSGLLLDIIQEGNYGLMRAISKFDVTREVKFITYANSWIVKYMYRFLINNELIKRTNREKTFGVDEKTRDNFFKEYGYEPSSQELIDMLREMGIPVVHKEDVEKITVISLDKPLLCDDGETTTIEIGDEDAFDDRVDLETIKTNLQEVLAKLTDDERYAVIKKFGLDGCLMEDTDIAFEMGISVYKVKKLQDSAMGKMRKYRYMFK